MRNVYLDSNSAMPVRPEVIEAMMEYFQDNFGNPSSIHQFGSVPKRAQNRAREEVASLINADQEEIIFTSGATESINMSLRGTLPHMKEGRKEIVYSAVDHQSVTNTARALSNTGYEVSVLPVDEDGRILIGKAEEIISGNTAVVSIPHASFEVGTIQPVTDLVKLAHNAGSLVHIDLTPSAFQLPFDVGKIPADLVSLSSNSLLGPKGAGALYVRKGTRISPLIRGGGHERGLRSGSANISGEVGMGVAARIASERMSVESAKMIGLRDRLINGLLKISDSYVNGHPTERLPNNSNVGFDYIEGESILLMLDMSGIAASSGSACTSSTLEPSPTLMAMGLKHEKAHGSIQFVLNPYNEVEDIDHVITVMPEIVGSLREMSPLFNK
ncbi:MAG: cysteine desulfurase family protein [Thermoplasmatota archaeon]